MIRWCDQFSAREALSWWNSTARLEFLNGNKDAALLLPATIYPANGDTRACADTPMRITFGGGVTLGSAGKIAVRGPEPERAVWDRSQRVDRCG